MSFDWKKTLSSVAPTIATVLTTANPLAGIAVKIATDALGIEDDDEKELERAIKSNNPDVLLKLKEAENTFTLKMKELDIKVSEISLKDRQGARALLSVNKWPQILLSALFVIGYFIILGLLLSGAVQIPDGLKEVVILLLGIITREVPTIMQFWFGSSSGSKDKSVKSEYKPF